ncbi:response regulator transcription factor [Nitrosophilus labii]|uniref:response regulator transcription factor n=1 Tax=Nitrosophilus labii TaxID=2706014 RepID=UPI001656F6F6|nr:response regulator transcription factor [Nitrosophilus labii]
MYILLVDDNEELLYSLEKILRNEKYSVDSVSNIEDAYQKIDYKNYNLIILDWILEDGNGVEFLKKIREDGFTTPVMMLSSKNEALDKAKALNLGADDYLEKPFSNIELLARVKAILRREFNQKKPVIAIKGVKLDSVKREVEVDGKKITLSLKEFELLELLMLNADMVLTKYQILQHISRDFDTLKGSNIVEAHIKNLRKKIKKDIIETVRGVGYIIKKN